jgi:hypothetical protein
MHIKKPLEILINKPRFWISKMGSKKLLVLVMVVAFSLSLALGLKFYAATNESGWVNDNQSGYQVQPFLGFTKTDGQYIVTWFNWSGTDGTTNAERNKQFNGFSMYHPFLEYDYTGCNERALPTYVGGESRFHHFTSSPIGQRYLSAYVYDSSSYDIYTKWGHVSSGGYEFQNYDGLSCTNGGMIGLTTGNKLICQNCTNTQLTPFTAASTDGNRYGICWASDTLGWPNYDVIFRLWDGVASGYDWMTTPVTPSSNNNCGASCGANEIKANEAYGDRDSECTMGFQPNATNTVVVCWQRYSGSAWADIYCRAFNNTGSNITREYVVESSANPQLMYDMTWLDNQSFVVAYVELVSSYYQAKFSIYYWNGTAIATGTTVNGTASLNHMYPSVAPLKNGEFVYTYTSDFGGTNGYDILAAIYYKNGTLSSGSNFVVNQIRANSQGNPTVESLPNTHDYIISWNSQNDSNWDGIKMRLFQGNDIDFCTDLIEPNTVYTLNSDISKLANDGRTACIDIKAANVTLDCAGHSITGTYDPASQGVQVNGYNYALIKNCSIAGFGEGVFFSNSNHSIVRDSSMTSDYYRGINIGNSNNFTAFNNRIATSGEDGIYLSSGGITTTAGNISYNYILNNQIGIDALGISSINITDNRIFNSSNYGMDFYSASSNFLIRNNITNSTKWDLALESASGNIITNLTTNHTMSSFTYSGTIFLKESLTQPGGFPLTYNSIGYFLNITNTTANAWIYLNVSYLHSDLGSLNESSLRIWKYSNEWSQNLNRTGALVSGVNNVSNYVYANISNFSSIFAPVGRLTAEEPPTPPVIMGISIMPSTIYPNETSDIIAVVTDVSGVNYVYARVEDNSQTNVMMSNVGGDNYMGTYHPDIAGTFSVYVVANDSFGTSGEQYGGQLTVLEPSPPSREQCYNISSLGLMGQSAHVSGEKLNKFVQINYYCLKNILGLWTHDFYFEVRYLNNTLVTIDGIPIQAGISSYAESNVVVSNRMALMEYNGMLVPITVTLGVWDE